MKHTLLAGLISLGIVTPGQAGFIMRLDDLTNQPLTIADGDALDSNPAEGAITFVGAVGRFTVNVTTGLSKPILPALDEATIDLNSVNLSNGPGTLLIELTDTDFTLSGPALNVVGTIEGTAARGVSWASRFDPDNMEFGGAVTANGVFSTGGDFAGTGSMLGIANTGPFSLTNTIIITHASPGVTSFDFQTYVTPATEVMPPTAAVPEPSTFALLGIGGLALARYGWRRKRQQAA